MEVVEGDSEEGEEVVEGGEEEEGIPTMVHLKELWVC